MKKILLGFTLLIGCDSTPKWEYQPGENCDDVGTDKETLGQKNQFFGDVGLCCANSCEIFLRCFSTDTEAECRAKKANESKCMSACKKKVRERQKR